MIVSALLLSKKTDGLCRSNWIVRLSFPTGLDLVVEVALGQVPLTCTAEFNPAVQLSTLQLVKIGVGNETRGNDVL